MFQSCQSPDNSLRAASALDSARGDRFISWHSQQNYLGYGYHFARLSALRGDNPGGVF